MAEQNEREILEDILKGVEELMVETKHNRKELFDLKRELDAEFQQGKLTELSYQIRCEQINRTHQNANYCMRSLERQKKIALQKLHELDQLQ